MGDTKAPKDAHLEETPSEVPLFLKVSAARRALLGYRRILRGFYVTTNASDKMPNIYIYIYIYQYTLD